ncbi:MAG: endonuclease III domain-containing protein [Gammaproteobacteria bacterium]|nr:endonuclease III domain-containing protein [Gammaproteobacteria bacterium]
MKQPDPKRGRPKRTVLKQREMQQETRHETPQEKPPAQHRAVLNKVYKTLFSSYGHQHWWPGDSPFEIMVGAILTQNAAWINVERAIDNLKTHACLSPQKILATPAPQLAEWLRPSGYFNIKAQRLRNYCQWYVDAGGLTALSRCDTASLRQQLLSVNGVGPETADDILLYAFERPVFVIDAYTRRLFSRLQLLEHDAGYEALRQQFESGLKREASLYNEYHALIVRHVKQVCRKRPDCTVCCLFTQCPYPKM